MNYPDVSTMLTTIAAQSFLMIVIGFLLKHELHDIKTRIMRLENIFIHTKEGE